MRAIEDVLNNFLRTKAQQGGVARIVGSPDQLSVLNFLPKYFADLLAKYGRDREFLVQGSIGRGNMNRVPWVAVFNREITTSAEKGYYIVLLFSEDMSGCFLSLNQGVTDMERRYTRQLAIKKMIEAGVLSRDYLEKHPEALYGEIDLHATNDLGRGYEVGAIESFYYASDRLPSEQEMKSHFKALLSNYDTLLRRVGTNLRFLAPISEAEFQSAVLRKASSTLPLELQEENGAGAPLPAMRAVNGRITYIRDPGEAAQALRDASFVCELDSSHWTFKSRASSRPYVEAHHLVPMSQQHRFDVSLDIKENIISLCANCHRLLHYGSPSERDPSIKKLLRNRSKRLVARNIIVDSRELLNFYSPKLTTEE